MQRLKWAMVVWLLGGCVGLARGADEAARKREEQAVRAAAQEYVEALARGDAKTLHAMWVAEGDIIDADGRALPAHDFIDQQAPVRAAAASGSGDRPVVKLRASTVRFLTDDVAVEDGTVDVTRKDQPTLAGRYAALWIKQEGRWRLASLREARLTPTRVDDLAALDWMVGHWSGRAGEASFDVTARWNAKHTFLERDLTVTHEGRVILDARQRIGFDPVDGKIKSWMHDDDGGHGEGLWTRHGETWVVQATGVTPDGKLTASTNTYTPTGPDGFTWKSTGGVSAGQSVADFEIKLKRAADEPAK